MELHLQGVKFALDHFYLVLPNTCGICPLLFYFPLHDKELANHQVLIQVAYRLRFLHLTRKISWLLRKDSRMVSNVKDQETRPNEWQHRDDKLMKAKKQNSTLPWALLMQKSYCLFCLRTAACPYSVDLIQLQAKYNLNRR